MAEEEKECDLEMEDDDSLVCTSTRTLHPRSSNSKNGFAWSGNEFRNSNCTELLLNQNSHLRT